MHFSKIIITTDLSESSKAAFEMVSYEKKMEGSEIILLHVFRYFEPAQDLIGFWNPDLMVNFAEQYKLQALKVMEKFAEARFHGQKLNLEVIVSNRSPANEILDYAKKEGAELIVMSSRGETLLGGLSLGSTVEGVLRRAKCPVLVVPVTQGAESQAS